MTNIARVSENTLNTRRVPIIFVPGVMGSRLHFTDIDQYWDPDSNLEMWHWVNVDAEKEMWELEFAAPAEVMTDQENEDLTEDENWRGWAGVAWRSYGEFLRWLGKFSFSPAICPLYCVGYDWRQSNLTSGKYLASAIANVLADAKAEKVILLTHSMGGLVARSAMKANPALEKQVLGVVHTVQPAAGAVVLYRRFFTGALGYLEGGGLFSTILGNTAAKFGAIMSGLPGPMELLPTRDLRDNDDLNWMSYKKDGETCHWPGNVYDLYRGKTVPPGLPVSDVSKYAHSMLIKLLNNAEVFHHKWLNGYKHPKTWTIFGTGVATDTSIVFDPGLRRPAHLENWGDDQVVYVPDDYGVQMRRTNQGDGTVPRMSAESLFPHNLGKQDRKPSSFVWEDDDTLRQYPVIGAEHEPAYKDDSVKELVYFMIRYFLLKDDLSQLHHRLTEKK